MRRHAYPRDRPPSKRSPAHPFPPAIQPPEATVSLFDPLNLFSGRTSQTGQSGFGLNSGLQSLRANFPSFLGSLPQNLLPNIFPGSGTGNPSPTAGGQGANAGPSVNGGGQSLTTPSGLNVPLPPSPFAAPNAGPVAPGTPQTGGGLLGSAGTVLNSVTDTVRSILNPGGQPPGAPASNAPGSSTGIGHASLNAGSLPAGVVSTAATVVSTVANTLTGAPQSVPQAGNQITAQAASTQQPTGPMQASLPQTSAVPAQQPAVMPQTSAQAAQPQPQPQPQFAQLQPQAASTLPQQATSVPVPQQMVPARTDAPFAPPGNPATDRAAVPQQAQAPVQTNAQSVPAAALLAAAPLAATVAQAPVTQQLAGNPQAQAGTPIAGTASLDAGGPVRAELTGAGIYTLDGPGLRRRGRMKVGAQELGQWMLAAAQGRLHLMRPYDDDTPRQVAKVFQQMFWVLAIVAYGCLGLVLISFLLSLGELPAAPMLRRWTGEFAWAGLLAAIGAWWLGRQLMRAQRPPPDPIRR
ncbi:MAG: hypothetical protein ACJ8GV_16595 [Luteimonas sp.]